MALHIRRYRRGEEAALWQVFSSAIHQLACQHYTAAQVDAWAPPDMAQEAWASRIQALNPWVAELEGDIVGYADVQPSGYIDHFFVAGGYARQGVGSRLMAHLHAQAQRQGVKVLTAAVSWSAEAFFLHHGFEVVERRRPVIRGVPLDNAWMRKDLVAQG